MSKSNYKKILFWLLTILIIAGATVFLILRFSGEKSLKLVAPNGGEKLTAGRTYQITWKSRNIEKVGIMLIKDKEPKESEWIVEDFPAGKGKYDWQIFTWQNPKQDYKIVIFEYPWYEENKIDYSDKRFTISGPTFASCDSLSIENEWPYLPSDFPNLKKVFITDIAFGGNLGGLEGADQKCQQEAEEKGLEGTWKAFLGDDTNLAIDRLDLEGIFVEAEGTEALPIGKIPPYFWQKFSQFLKETKSEEKKTKIEEAYNLLEKYFKKFVEEWEGEQEKRTCHRLLGRNFDDFFQKLSDSLVVNQEKLTKEFLEKLTSIWLGRINKESKQDCIFISTEYPYSDPSLNYSFTTTCQNWKNSEEKIPGYPAKEGEKKEFSICYTSEGKKINAAGLAGLSLGRIEKDKTQFFTLSLGRSCNKSQRLLCIQQ